MKTLANILSSFCVLALTLNANAQYKIEVLDTTSFQLGEGVVLNKTSFRGLSVVDDKTVWVSGCLGTIARSTNGGKTFQYTQLKGYEQSDFRDIEAFDDKRAIIMSSGFPALILKTIDGGQSWKEVFRKNDSAYFLDAMDFWDENRGMMVGDPINGRFVLLQTVDGGETWQQFDEEHSPLAVEGEALFAASGTSLRCWQGNEFGFVTGGTKSRFIYTHNLGKHWKEKSTNIFHGAKSQGAFSFIYDTTQFNIVGGDYLNIYDNKAACSSLYIDEGLDGYQFNHKVNGFSSCIEFIQEFDFITTGPRGSEFICTEKQTNTWTNISKEPFHVIHKAKKGKAVFLAGPKGKIGRLNY